MLRTVRHCLRILLVAAAFVASGLSGYSSAMAALDVHDHAHHATDAHSAHHASGESDDAESGGLGDHTGCDHMHAQCCISLAVTAGDCGVKIGLSDRAGPAIGEPRIPASQLTSPLYRPPSAAA